MESTRYGPTINDQERPKYSIGYAITAVSFVTFGLEVAITWMNYWSKSMNYRVFSLTCQ